MKWTCFSSAASNWCKLLGSFLILVAGVCYLLYSKQIKNPLPDKQVTSYFRAANCQLVSKKLGDDRLIVKRYRADFLVSYKVERVYYRRWVHGNGLDDSYFTDESEQEDILSRYHVGGYYRCYYNPDNANSVVLVPRHHWSSMAPLATIVLAMLLALYYFLANLLMLVGINSKKRKSKGK